MANLENFQDAQRGPHALAFWLLLLLVIFDHGFDPDASLGPTWGSAATSMPSPLRSLTAISPAKPFFFLTSLESVQHSGDRVGVESESVAPLGIYVRFVCSAYMPFSQFYL